MVKEIATQLTAQEQQQEQQQQQQQQQKQTGGAATKPKQPSTGTAAEITPVRSIDKITIGSGKRGPVTERLQKAFFDVIECRVPDEHGWLTFVREAGAATAGAARSTSAG